MDDSISRRVAIDALCRRCDLVAEDDEPCTEKCNDIKILEKLPSAQPENIRCYECKYGTHSGCGNVYICNVSPELVMKHTGDFYCGYAERKTNEEVDLFRHGD